ncbi:MAG: hypothetical protein Tsb009_14720 [Planctomycetaceae bacterium]
MKNQDTKPETGPENKSQKKTSSDAEWGLAVRRTGMAKETKIGLALIVVLVCAFSVVVYKKFQDRKDLLAGTSETGEPAASEKKSSASSSQVKNDEDELRNQQQQNEPKVLELANRSQYPMENNQNGNSGSLGAGTSQQNNPFEAGGSQSQNGGAGSAESEAPVQTFNLDENQNSQSNGSGTLSGSSPAGQNPFGSQAQQSSSPENSNQQSSFPQNESQSPANEQPMGLFPGTQTPDQNSQSSGTEATGFPQTAQQPFERKSESAYGLQEQNERNQSGSFGALDNREKNEHGVGNLPDQNRQGSSQFANQENNNQFGTNQSGYSSPGNPESNRAEAKSSTVVWPQNSTSDHRSEASSNNSSFGNLQPQSSGTSGTNSSFSGNGYEQYNRSQQSPEPENRFLPNTNQSFSQQGDASQAGGKHPYYTVQPGDNYWTISKKAYGKGRYFQALAEFNRRRIPDPRKMRPGMKVLTPEIAVLKSAYPSMFPKSKSSQTSGSGSVVQAGFYRDSTGQPYYRVAKGDSLSKIAQRHLGRSSRWIQLYQMNRDRLKNSKSLKIGTELRLPADASRIRLVREPRQYR